MSQPAERITTEQVLINLNDLREAYDFVLNTIPESPYEEFARSSVLTGLELALKAAHAFEV